MGGKICLDTDVCIEVLRSSERSAEILNKTQNKEVFVTSVTAYELLLRKTNLDVVKVFLGNLQILDFDKQSAMIASEMTKSLKEKGKMIQPIDIFIAAISKSNDCPLLTFNTNHFSYTGVELA